MKSLIQAAVVVTVISAPVFCTAQSIQPVTRAQVRAELLDLERAGYHVSDGHTNYPDSIQAAEARVAARQTAETDYGGAPNETSVSNVPADTASLARPKSLYYGH